MALRTAPGAEDRSDPGDLIANERALQRVLGIGGAPGDAAQVPMKRSAVTQHQLAERLAIALGDARDQLWVAGGPWRFIVHVLHPNRV